MNTVVKLNVPPFEPASPTSLSALRRPLVDQAQPGCDAHCQPCASCEAKQADAIAEARKLSQDTALRLSQLVEDALVKQLARIEAEQVALVTTVLTTVLPHLADATLRSLLADEIATLSDGSRGTTFILVKHPDLDLGPLADDARLSIACDDALTLHHVELRREGGTTHINPQPLIDACLARLNVQNSRD
ncbi:hypothetical protein ACFFUB_10525 [Algimonas porphyrae]|uniref:Flagellar assembly protein FliH/Type III secretion system HrpE domain-containing protein n=1 Tax=Algimonas porphyrae TaxID=1128113 RepID=A0ABQ5V1U9_9PROT|nr:hypothetical protein [Algimonas porphyrae]GLQ21451.1 hypothetical protein GCM10007854_24060 [Algimonas porphyrae]